MWKMEICSLDCLCCQGNPKFPDNVEQKMKKWIMHQTHVTPLFAYWSGEQMGKDVFVGFTCLLLTLAGSIGQTETSFFGKVDEASPLCSYPLEKCQFRFQYYCENKICHHGKLYSWMWTETPLNCMGDINLVTQGLIVILWTVKKSFGAIMFYLSLWSLMLCLISVIMEEDNQMQYCTVLKILMLLYEFNHKKNL